MTRVLVVGAGAIGCLYGGLLQLGGLDVTYLVRPRQRDAFQAEGIRISGAHGARTVFPVKVATDIDKVGGPVDVLLLTVKLYDLAQALADALPGLTPNGLVVGLQNGLDAFEMIATRVPGERIAVGPVYLAARMLGVNHVEFGGARDSVILGNPAGVIHPALPSLVEAWRRAGVDGQVSDDIQRALWLKLLPLATNAALTCLTRLPAGVVYHHDELIDLARQSIAEVAAVARAEGIPLTERDEVQSLGALAALPFHVVASMRQDLDAGRRLELDGLVGAVVRRGRAASVPTPFHSVAYACLGPYRDGPPN